MVGLAGTSGIGTKAKGVGVGLAEGLGVGEAAGLSVGDGVGDPEGVGDAEGLGLAAGVPPPPLPPLGHVVEGSTVTAVATL